LRCLDGAFCNVDGAIDLLRRPSTPPFFGHGVGGGWAGTLIVWSRFFVARFP
jgi:hypothetical protein